MKNINIRKAVINDVNSILGFIEQLAEYEELGHEVVADAEQLEETLFCKNPTAHVLIGEINGEACGFALYFYNYSTFQGKPGVYLEDLFVNDVSRGSGLGKALLIHLAKIAKSNKCGRLEWSVLNWNKPAIDFYLSIGATPIDGWTKYRLDEDTIKKIRS